MTPTKGTRMFEIPLILTVQADDRGEAEDQATDVADAIGDLFPGTSAVAVITRDHNLLDRLQINYEGEGAP